MAMASNALLLSLLVLAIANVHSLKVNDTCLIRIILTGKIMKKSNQ